MKLQEVDRIGSQLLPNRIGILENVVRREYVLITIFRRGWPLVVFRRYLGCRIQPLAFVARDNLTEQAVALAVPVRPGAIEKVTTQIDSQLQRLERIFIFGT